MSSIRLLFYVTLMLLIGFTFSFPRDIGLVNALPWVIAMWIASGLGVAWVWSRAAGGFGGAPSRCAKRAGGQLIPLRRAVPSHAVARITVP